MRTLLSQHAMELKQGGIRAFFDKAAHLEDVVSLGIGEPDFGTPRELIEESYQRMLKGATHYTQNAGAIETRTAVAKFLKTYGVTRDPETEIIMTCGGMGALSLAFLCLLDPGDEVLIQDPQWLNYRAQVIFCGGVPVPVSVYEEDEFRLNVAKLEKHVTDRTKVLIINSPNNPTGAVLSREDLEAIAAFAKRYDILVISDEVYSGLVYDGKKHLSIAALPNMAERTLVISSFSKMFAMTGWRLGYAAGNKEIIHKMILLQENLSACAPAPAQAVAKLAFDTMCGIEEMRTVYCERRNLMVDGLNGMKHISCLKPKGAFYLFVNIKKSGMSSADFADKLLAKQRVVTIPGTAFGANGEGFLRMSYANSSENLEKALERINRFVKTI